MKSNLPATKADLEKFTTRKEFKVEVAKLATKEELKREVAKLATKEDLKRFATKQDLKNMEKVIRAEAHLDFDEFRQEINKKLNLLPTKEEFFNYMDKVMGELQTTRDEQILLSEKSSNHDDRITVLEQKAGIPAV